MNTYDIMHVHTTIHMHMHVYMYVYTWKYRYAQRIGDRAYRLVSEGDDTPGGGASGARTNEDDGQRGQASQDGRGPGAEGAALEEKQKDGDGGERSEGSAKTDKPGAHATYFGERVPAGKKKEMHLPPTLESTRADDLKAVLTHIAYGADLKGAAEAPLPPPSAWPPPRSGDLLRQGAQDAAAAAAGQHLQPLFVVMMRACLHLWA